MPGDNSVGQIGLDLVVNKNNFNQQMAGIQGVAKKAGLAIAAAFGTKKLIDFGKQCISLGSDLAEVQNVVDVTFTGMSAKVDKFAKDAAKNFGLSETMAKRYAGTFGAMAKAFGFTEKEAYDMSTALTGLAGDVASFYNISQDEAYTKLKSVFTGETESLKDLGVVMTQTALDQYALQNGFGKTTKAMSEQEKVALRYAFVQNQLNTAAGDFSRTSGSWANQVRLLTLQFESLKAAIGQGLIAVFTPVIRVVNILIGRLLTAVNAVRALFAAFGKAGKAVGGLAGKMAGLSGNTKNATNQTRDFSDANNDAFTTNSALGEGARATGAKAAKAAKKAADSAKKASKKMRSLMSFDQMNKVEKKNTSSSGSSGSPGGGAGGGGAGGVGDIGSIDTGGFDKATVSAGKLDKRMQALVKRAKELRDRFKKGFAIGFGDSEKRITEIKRNLREIGKDLKEIFTDKEVAKAANHFLDRFAESLGKRAGAQASIGITIATLITGGFRRFLKARKKDIKKWLIDMFDVSGDIAEIKSNFDVAFADIFSVFGGKNAQKILANVLKIFYDIGSTASLLALKVQREFSSMFTKPITKNKDKIKTILNGVLGVFSSVTGSISTLTRLEMKGIMNLYDQHIKPLLDDIGDDLAEVYGIILDGYNKYVVPALNQLAREFDKVIKKDVWPAIKNLLKSLGNLFDVIRLSRKTWQPLIKTVAKALIPIIVRILALILKLIGYLALNRIKNTTKAVSLLFGAISKGLGIIKAGYKKFQDFVKLWKEIKNKKAELVAEAKEKVEGALEKLKEGWEVVENKTAELVTQIKEKVELVQEGWNTVEDWVKSNLGGAVSKTVDLAKNGWNTVEDWVKSNLGGRVSVAAEVTATTVGSGWTTIKTVTSGLASAAKKKAYKFTAKMYGDWSNLKSYVTKVITKVRNKTISITARAKGAWSWLVEKAQNLKRLVVSRAATYTAHARGLWSTIAKNAKQTYDNVKSKTATFRATASGAWDKIKETLSSVARSFYNKTVTMTLKFVTSGWDYVSSKWQQFQKWIHGRASGGIYKGGRWSPIQSYASGGTPNQGQMFVAREAGPELVGTLGGHTAVMNNDQIVASVSAGVYKAVASAMGKVGQSLYNAVSSLRIETRLPDISAKALPALKNTESSAQSTKDMAEIKSLLRSMQAGSKDTEMVALFRQMLLLMDQVSRRPIYLDGREVTDKVVRRINDTTRSTGKSPVLV